MLRSALDALGFAPCAPLAGMLAALHAADAAQPTTADADATGATRTMATRTDQATTRRRSVHTLDVRQTGPRRYVAELVGTPYWSAGPTREYAVGALVLAHGDRMGVGVDPGDVPFVRVARPM